MREDLLGWLTLLVLIASSVAVTAAAVWSQRRHRRADPYLPTTPDRAHRRDARVCVVHDVAARLGGGRR